MSPATSTLPAGWSDILDEMHARLSNAIAAADVRMEQIPQVGAAALAQERRQDFAALCDRLQQLGTYLESAQQIVRSVDEALEKEETHIQQQLAACETLRQKVG